MFDISPTWWTPRQTRVTVPCRLVEHVADRPEGSLDPSDDEVAALLRRVQTIAVVGISARPGAASHGVAAYLLDHAPGYQLWFVNPTVTEVLGQRCYPSLAALPIVPDLVDIFRRTDDLPAAADEAIAVGALALWFQLGLRHDVAASRARRSGLFVVQDRCIEIEHALLS